MGTNFTTVTATITVTVTVTVFTFLFAVTTALISDSPLVHTTCGSNSDSNLVILPIETTRLNLRSDGADHVKRSETDRLFRVGLGLTPRSDFARFRAINRRFSDQHRRFQNVHRNRNEAVLTGKSDARKLHHHGAASRFMKFRHDYGHHHHQQHQQHHIRHNAKDVTMPKHKFVPQKVKEETRENEVSFMKSIRKFLKHTFE